MIVSMGNLSNLQNIILHYANPLQRGWRRFILSVDDYHPIGTLAIKASVTNK